MANNNDYLKNMQTITGLTSSTIRKYNSLEVMSLQNNIYLDKQNGELNVYTLYTQYGTILINVEDKDNLKFKFVPDAKFLKSVKESLSEDFTPLEEVMEENLKEKFTSLFKGLF